MKLGLKPTYSLLRPARRMQTEGGIVEQ